MMTLRIAQTSVLVLSLLATGGCHKKPAVSVVEEPVAPPPPAPPVPLEPVPPPVVAEMPIPGPATFDAVYFDFDSAALRPDQQAVLMGDLAQLTAHPEIELRIEGNCDERGSTEYNLALGQRRADVVRDWLVAEGISPGRLTTLSFGEEMPVDSGHDEVAWARNRRDELRPEEAPVAERD